MNLGEKLKQSIEDNKISDLAKNNPIASALFSELSQKKIEITESINDGYIVEKIVLDTVVPDRNRPDVLLFVMAWFSEWCQSEGLYVGYENNEVFGFETTSLVIWPYQAK